VGGGGGKCLNGNSLRHLALLPKYRIQSSRLNGRKIQFGGRLHGPPMCCCPIWKVIRSRKYQRSTDMEVKRSWYGFEKPGDPWKYIEQAGRCFSSKVATGIQPTGLFHGHPVAAGGWQVETRAPPKPTSALTLRTSSGRQTPPMNFPKFFPKIHALALQMLSPSP